MYYRLILLVVSFHVFRANPVDNLPETTKITIHHHHQEHLLPVEPVSSSTEPSTTTKIEDEHLKLQTDDPTSTTTTTLVAVVETHSQTVTDIGTTEVPTTTTSTSKEPLYMESIHPLFLSEGTDASAINDINFLPKIIAPVRNQLRDTGMMEFSVFIVVGFSCTMCIYALWVYRSKIFALFRRNCLSSDWRAIVTNENRDDYQMLHNVHTNNAHQPHQTEMDRLPLTMNSDDGGDDEEVDFFGAIDSQASASRPPVSNNSQRQTGGSTSSTPLRLSTAVKKAVKNYVF